MGPTDAVAVLLIAAAVWGVYRGWDVRLVLLAAALALGGLAGDPAPVVRTFLETFSNEKFVVPICSAMGFAYVLKHTGCDRHLVRVLVEPGRRVRPLTVPGVVLAGFVVNVPVISQTSTAVCLGAVVVPVMRAAGFGPAATGSALLLGASVGGELLNPAAPELLTIQDKTGVATGEMRPAVLPLVLPVLVVSTLVLWAMTRASRERERPEDAATTSSPSTTGPPVTYAPGSPPDEPLNPLKAIVPLIPLALLFLSGPPLNLFEVPLKWLAEPKAAAAATSRLIALAMLVGVAAAALAAPRKAGACMMSFFEGAGYGFTHIVSLIVTANCFGKGIELVHLADHLGGLIAAEPRLLHPLAGFVPWAFAWVCGSGMASTQSLYGFFHGPATAAGADPVAVGAMVSVGAAAGRTMSPVAAVTLMCGTLVGVNPWELIKRVGPALVAGLTAAVVLRTLGVV